jgi:geranylgeranyl pyrophosphate synthase/uncharacterized protein with NAD-binding domain and iron-sulfur cluster
MPSAVVLGGGVAGLTAAHELAERGFAVTVFERRGAVGGKARSLYGAPSTTRTGPERYSESSVPWAPGEHGFRFFPGFYRHVIDTMGRIPTTEGATAADALVGTTRVGITQYDRAMFELPARFPHTPDDLATALGALLHGISPLTGLTTDDIAFFAGRVWQLVTSCPQRRLAELEAVSWWIFTDADNRSDAYRKFLVEGQTRSLVAAQARRASTRTVGDMFIQLALRVFDPTAGYLDRVLDGPTTDVWIDPWRARLAELGVQIRTGTEVREIQCAAGRIAGVAVERSDGSRETIVADHYVCALPIERTAPLMSPQILAADPSLASLAPLAANVEWMNGSQFYLIDDVPMLPGHVIHMDSEWALTSISQVQFWRPEWYDRYLGDVEFNGILSVDISDWNAPGGNGKAAIECTPEEVAAEVWRQMKTSMNGAPDDPDVLIDANLAGWLLDPDIAADLARSGRLANLEPLLVNYVDTWRLRPEAGTAIPNLVLAGDYVRTHTDLATMEAANEAARRAVNAILDAADHDGPRCSIWPLQEPPVFAPFVAYDEQRFALGLPWDATLYQVAAAALATGILDLADPALRTVSELIGSMTSFVDVPAVSAPAVTAPRAEGPAGFNERLDWYRELALDALLQAIPDAEPAAHLYDPIREYVARPSKGLRPALCLATAGAHGGDVMAALPSAAGLELLHNAFLVHDDIEDAGLSRRGRPAMHRQIGVPLAVNAGDAMQALAMRLFRSNLDGLCPQVVLRIVDEVDHLLIETLEGQAMELGWIRDRAFDVDTDDYLRLVQKKTAWYSFIHPMRIGALTAGGPAAEDLDRFDRLGFLLGAAFQIQDDVLNLVGIGSRYGKQIGGDLDEGKRTLVLTHALARSTSADRSRLTDFLTGGSRVRLEREQAGIHDVLARTGSIDWARAFAADLAAAAMKELDVAYADAAEGPDLDFVRSVVAYVVDRDV